MKYFPFFLSLSAMVAFGQINPSDDWVSLDHVAEALAKGHAEAVNGNLESCLEIWHVGRFIDKHEILRNQYPAVAEELKK